MPLVLRTGTYTYYLLSQWYLVIFNVLIITNFMIFISPGWERDLPKVTQQVRDQEG